MAVKMMKRERVDTVIRDDLGLSRIVSQPLWWS